MQEILEAIVQGIVQGVTEFLPVSSSGHLSLVQHVMGVQNTSLLFNVMLHIGTLAAVLIAYRKLIWRAHQGARPAFARSVHRPLPLEHDG